ncbi:MAG: hypothetical protein Q4B04_03925 [bacterium]|nr:hypothetical protein [bacterium]
MKTILITASYDGNVIISDTLLGHSGEHNNAQIKVMVDNDILENCHYYKLWFDGRSTDNLYVKPSDNCIYFTVPQEVMRPPKVNCQIAGYACISDETVYMWRSNTFKLDVLTSEHYYPVISNKALAPLDTALLRCANTTAAAQKQIDTFFDLNSSLETIIDETRSLALSAKNYSDAASRHTDEASRIKTELSDTLSSMETKAELCEKISELLSKRFGGIPLEDEMITLENKKLNFVDNSFEIADDDTGGKVLLIPAKRANEKSAAYWIDNATKDENGARNLVLFDKDFNYISHEKVNLRGYAFRHYFGPDFKGYWAVEYAAGIEPDIWEFSYNENDINKLLPEVYNGIFKRSRNLINKDNIVFHKTYFSGALMLNPYCCTSNLFKVKPNTNYYCLSKTTLPLMRASFLDSKLDLVSSFSLDPNQNYFTTPEQAQYCCIMATENHEDYQEITKNLFEDVMISEEEVTEYEPYLVLTVEGKLTAGENIKIERDETGYGTISLDTTALSAIESSHEHENINLLNSYQQTEADLAEAVEQKHTHVNSSILNSTTAAFTDEEKEKLSGIEENSQVNIIESVMVDGNELNIENKQVNIDLSSKVDKNKYPEREVRYISQPIPYPIGQDGCIVDDELWVWNIWQNPSEENNFTLRSCIRKISTTTWSTISELDSSLFGRGDSVDYLKGYLLARDSNTVYFYKNPKDVRSKFASGGANFSLDNLGSIDLNDAFAGHADGSTCFADNPYTIYYISFDTNNRETHIMNIYKILLGMGSHNQKLLGGYGTFVSGKSDDVCNGTYRILKTYTGILKGDYNRPQGMSYNGKIYVSAGHGYFSDIEAPLHVLAINLNDYDNTYTVEEDLVFRDVETSGYNIKYESELCALDGPILYLGGYNNRRVEIYNASGTDISTRSLLANVCSQMASTEYVDNAIAEALGSLQSAIDALNEGGTT